MLSLRLVLYAAVPVMGIIVASNFKWVSYMIDILGQVSSVTLFPVRYDFPVSAGLAPFNGSFASYYPQSYLQYLAFSQTPSLFNDPFWVYGMDSGAAVAPACLEPESNCSSYLMVGGMEAISPYPNLVTQFPEADAFRVFGEQGLQADYWNIDPSDAVFPSSSCQVWSTSEGDFAIMVCIKTSVLDQNNLVWGMRSSVRQLTVRYCLVCYRDYLVRS